MKQEPTPTVRITHRVDPMDSLVNHLREHVLNNQQRINLLVAIRSYGLVCRATAARYDEPDYEKLKLAQWDMQGEICAHLKLAIPDYSAFLRAQHLLWRVCTTRSHDGYGTR